MKTNGRPHIAPVPKSARGQVQAAQAAAAMDHEEDLRPGANGALVKKKGMDLLKGAQAFGLWLLLERPPLNDEKSAGGIILPDAVREKPHWIVRSIGEKVTLPIKPGDAVIFDGTRIMEDRETGTAWCFAMEGQIMGKLDPSKLSNRIITQRAAL